MAITNWQNNMKLISVTPKCSKRRNVTSKNIDNYCKNDSLSADLVAYISFGMRAESPDMSQLGLISEKRKKIMSYHELDISTGLIRLIAWIKWQVLHGERLHLKFLASFLTMLSTQVINDSPASKFSMVTHGYAHMESNSHSVPCKNPKFQST